MRVAEQLVRCGHQPLVIAPAPARRLPKIDPGFPVLRVPAVGLPLYPGFRVGLPGGVVRDAIAPPAPTSCTWPGPWSWVLAAALRLGGLACRRSPSTRPTWPPMPGPTISALLARRLAGGICAGFTTGRIVRSLRARQLRLCCAPAASGGCTSGAGAWIRPGSIPARRSASLRRDLTGAGDLIVGYVGLVGRREAARPAQRRRRTARGSTRDRRSRSAEAAARRVLPRALFLGQRQGDELARVYASLDVFVHSGPHETFGNTLQEAAASGLPVVAPAAGGPVDLVEHGITGLLVAPGDAGALARAVSDLAANADLRAAMGLACRRAMLARTWPSRCEELVGHYEAALGVLPLREGTLA